MQEINIEGHTLELDHMDKVLFPKEGLTKQDLMNYYLKIADKMLPHLKNRPLTLFCCPKGINEQGFVRQHAFKSLPEWFETVNLKMKTDGEMTHILCQNKASLAYLINQNTITINRWLSTLESIEKPDIMVIDIDPPNDSMFGLACKGAKLIKEELEKLKYKCSVMTTGSRGLHVAAEVKGLRFDETRQISVEIAEKIVKKFPDELSHNISKEKRENLVYLDTSRNAYGQTVVAPFSVRAKETASVAAPIKWSELEEKNFSSSFFNIKSKELFN